MKKPVPFCPARQGQWPSPRHAALPATWPGPAPFTIQDDFIRGSITTAMLVALQRPCPQGVFSQRTLRLAIQGGSALAAGNAAVHAIRQGRHGQALMAVAAGAAAVLVAEHFMQEPTDSKEYPDGEE